MWEYFNYINIKAIYIYIEINYNNILKSILIRKNVYFVINYKAINGYYNCFRKL